MSHWKHIIFIMLVALTSIGNLFGQYTGAMIKPEKTPCGLAECRKTDRREV